MNPGQAAAAIIADRSSRSLSQSPRAMKWGAAAAAASAAATAVASAASSAAGERRASPCSSSTGSPSREDDSSSSSSRRTAGATAEDSFAPRFDGLRFIETLVTAHR